MRMYCAIIASGIFLSALTPQALGAENALKAKALVEEAIAYYTKNGKEKALAEFSKPQGRFVNGDLYIFAYNPKGIIIAHGGDLSLVGQDFTGVQDADGKYFAREFIKIGPEGGWVDYQWMNYKTKTVETKTSYLKRVDDVIVGCGTYK